MREQLLIDVMRDYVPGSYDDWSWEDEEADIAHDASTAYWVERGVIDDPVLLGDDGRVWDGHHRIIAAKLLGLATIPCNHWRS